MPVSPPIDMTGDLADVPACEIVVTETGRRAITADPDLTDEQRAFLTAIAYVQDAREAREEREDMIAALRCLTGHMRRRIRLAPKDAAYIVSCAYDSFVLGR